MSHIAFLGTGLLGGAFAEAAAKRGDTVTVWNRTLDKARALEQFGVQVADTPADAVRGIKHVHLVLKDDPVVEEVIAALRPGLDNDAIIIDHTTTAPAPTAARARRLNDEGVHYIHCPVFIGPAAARQAKGTIMAAGPRALFDAIRPELERMAERVVYFGERPDLAAVYKLCGNAFIVGMSALVADVYSMASAADVDPASVLEILDYFNPASLISGRGRNMLARNYAPGFELAMARKDVRLMLETAKGRALGVLPGIAARMDQLIDSGHGNDDLAVLGVDAVG
ncbi:MAG TPA: NAD(P)-dependent oxidoreductase [Gemmatimonadaceae bacterium]|nr:NAD(P)-dependent oxidoreductase [Gemmatimonadaceae bacterium]